VAVESARFLTRRPSPTAGLRLLVGIVLALPPILWMGPASPSASAATAAPSAIGNEAVYWLAVSPSYSRTGTVVALTLEAGSSCGSHCKHLWVTRNGGSTWVQAKAQGWAGVRPAVAVDATGHEVIFDGGGSNMVRSDDLGDTWRAVGPAAVPATSPHFAEDGIVANAGNHDYIYASSGGSIQPVSGSGGKYLDLGFALPPNFPNQGSNPVAFLVGEDSNSQLPVVEQCSGSLTCSNPTTLSGVQPGYADTTLLFSTRYASDGTIFARNGRGIFKSVNGGSSFAPVPVGASSATQTATPMMALAPDYSEAASVKRAYVAVLQIFGTGQNSTSSGGVYATSDGGLTWTRLGAGSPLEGGASGIAMAPDGRLFAGYLPSTSVASGARQAGLLCSTDGGTTWRASCPPVGGQTSGGDVKKPSGASQTAAPNCGSAGCTAVTGRPAGSVAAGAGSDGATPSPGPTDPGRPGLIAGGTKQGPPIMPIALGAAVALVLAGGAGWLGIVRRKSRRQKR